jgi:hypothetical protein
MMRKTFKYISVFSLWLAGLIMSAHLIIPHDHHLADSFSNQDLNCPASNNHSKHPSGFPIHCHAFNVLSSEKLRPVHVSQNIQYIFISFSKFSDRSKIELPVSSVSIIDIQSPNLDPFALDLSLLRAPPVSV